MDSTSFHKCQTHDEVKDSHYTYLQNYATGLRNCECKKPCKELFYKTTISTDPLPFKTITAVYQCFYSNTIQIIMEKLAYTSAKLLSDIGSILALGLGISVLSIHSLIISVKTYYNRAINGSTKQFQKIF